MSEFDSFYNSPAWKNTRDAYYRERQGLCEICREQGRITPGEIVHHKIHLSKETINDPDVALNTANLQLLCRFHHAEMHKKYKKRYTFDAYGRVTALE